MASARQAMRVLGALVHVPGSRNRASLFVKPRHEMGKGRRSVILAAGYGVPLNVALGIVVADVVQMSAELFLRLRDSNGRTLSWDLMVCISRHVFL